MNWWKLAPYASLVALAVGVWLHGHSSGYASCQSEADKARRALQAELTREADALSRRAYDLQLREAELSTRAQEAEDAARADFDVCRVPDPRSLQRLERRWQRVTD